MGLLIVTMMYPTTESETPCPVCGGKEWLPYHYELLKEDFRVVELNPKHAEYFTPAVDAPPDDGYWLDECVECGTGICAVGVHGDDDENDIGPYPELKIVGKSKGPTKSKAVSELDVPSRQQVFEWEFVKV